MCHQDEHSLGSKFKLRPRAFTYSMAAVSFDVSFGCRPIRPSYSSIRRRGCRGVRVTVGLAWVTDSRLTHDEFITTTFHDYSNNNIQLCSGLSQTRLLGRFAPSNNRWVPGSCRRGRRRGKPAGGDVSVKFCDDVNMSEPLVYYASLCVFFENASPNELQGSRSLVGNGLTPRCDPNKSR